MAANLSRNSRRRRVGARRWFGLALHDCIAFVVVLICFIAASKIAFLRDAAAGGGDW